MTMPDVKKRAENIDASMLMCESRKERIATIEMHLQQAMIASQSKVDELLEKQREACYKAWKDITNTAEQHDFVGSAIRNAKIGDSDD